MDDDLHQRIDDLVAEEHDLRSRRSSGSGLTEQDRARLADLEVRLDRTWDLLRQRGARRAAGQDPQEARERPEDVVEGYVN